MKHLIFLVYFGFGGLLYGQGVTDEFVESLVEKDNKEALSCIKHIKALNDLLQIAGINDTITYFRRGDELLYKYKDQIIPNPLVDTSKVKSFSVLTLNRAYRTTILSLLRIGPNKQLKLEQYEVFDREQICHPERLEITMVLSHLTDGVLDDGWVKYDQFGHPLLVGRYQQIDSIYTDSIARKAPETYEVVYIPVQRNKYPKRIKHWIFLNPEGDTLKVEHYPEKYD